MIRNFEIIGEASRNIERGAPNFVTAHPELPLSFAYDMRNELAQGYYDVLPNALYEWLKVRRPGKDSATI
ncbi:MAG: DUF86 domain-containing protein [Limnohabitans sp.]